VAFLVESTRPGPEKTWHQRKTDRQDDAMVVHRELRPMEIWRQPMDGKATRLFRGDPGIGSFDVSPDGKRIAYVTNHTGVPSDDAKAEVVVLDLSDGTTRPLTRGRGGGEDMARWSPDGKRIAFVAPSDPAVPFSRHDVLVADPDGEAAPVSATASYDRTAEVYRWAPDGTLVAAVPRGHDHVIIRASADGETVREVVADRRYALLPSVAASTGRLVFASEGPAAPPEIWTCEKDGEGLRCLTALNDCVAEWVRAPREIVSWENEGFEHQGILVRPVEPGEGPPPLLVMVHGGPHAQAPDRLQQYQAEAWAAEGWAVLMPHFRGSCGHGDAYGRASFRDIGGADFRDILAGVDRVLEMGAADPERMAIAGGSYGGYMTNWALARSDRFRAGVSLFGIYSLFGDFDASEHPDWDKDYLGGYYWDDPTLYVERSVSTYVRDLTAPLLLLHGVEDDNTFITNSKSLYRALRELGRTVQLVVYPREGHGFREPSHRLDAFRRTRAWLDRHVLAGGGAPEVRDDMEVSHEEHPAVRLRVTSSETCSELGGRRPAEGRCWLVLEGYLRGGEGVDALSLEPAGPRGQLVLHDPAGRPVRPVGVPLDVLDQRVLLEGAPGRVETARAEDGTEPTLPFAVIYDLPAEPARWTLRVSGYPPVGVEVSPPRDP
jgi:dipeptidyl aminopeptidase/acylaminoacyl peptidase